MTCKLKKRRHPSLFLRIITSREVVAAMLLIAIALLTWALVNDRGVLIPYRDAARKQVMQTPLYDHGDVQHETVTLDDIQEQ